MQPCLLATLRQVGISKINTLPNTDVLRTDTQDAKVLYIVLRVQRRHGGPKHEVRRARARNAGSYVHQTASLASLQPGGAHPFRRAQHTLPPVAIIWEAQT